MLEETGIVVGVEDHQILVETKPRSACSHCGTGSCTTSTVAKLFGARRNRLRLDNSLHAVRGQAVVVGIPDQALVSVSILAYMVPLLAMILGVVGASALGLGEVTQALVAILGLLLGLSVVGSAGNSKRARRHYAPRLLRLAESPGIQIQLPDMKRST
jgi:sigma-E factor negative regulatory protein RseC